MIVDPNRCSVSGMTRSFGDKVGNFLAFLITCRVKRDVFVRINEIDALLS
jgi:hypothetical protein